MRNLHVDIWSDIVCPWCYVGKRRFERALAAFEHRDAVQVVHRSFQLDPATPRGFTADRRGVLMQKYGWSGEQADAMNARMVQIAAAEGLEYHLDGGLTGNTFDAHRLLHLARAQGVQDAMVERLYRAHFTEGRSIFDTASLVALAGEASLDREAARRVLAGEEYSSDVAADLAEARALGANGVPFFVVANRFGVSGAQAPEVFTEALVRAWAEGP